MADVILGRAGSAVEVDLDVCAKTGRPTGDRVTLRGSTTPAWVTILLLFTVIGWLLAGAMTSRAYRVTLPLVHEVHGRWKRNRRLAWAAGLVGVGTVLAEVVARDDGPAGGFAWAGLVLFVVALVGGTLNSSRNGVGFRMTRDNDLVLTRAHVDFARAVARASVETTSR